MPAPWIPIQFLEIFYQAGSQWIEMDIADQFQEVRGFFADDGFVSVLKQMTCPLVPLVEGDGIPGHQFAHDLAKWGRASAQQEMKMVRDQGPGVALRPGLFQDARQTGEERPAVFVIKEDLSSFNAPGHRMLQKARDV